MTRRRSYIRRRVCPRARRKGTRAALARECAALWSAKVKARDRYTCQLCWQPANDAHHIWNKQRHPAGRYLLTNGVTLCRFPCHQLAHRYELDFKTAMRERMGADAFERLRQRACGSQRVDLSEVRKALA